MLNVKQHQDSVILKNKMRMEKNNEEKVKKLEKNEIKAGIQL